jgi:hypothetical protein
MHNQLNQWLIRARAQELHRTARERLPASQREPVQAVPPLAPVTLRFAFPDDEEAVARLAALDCAQPPPMPALVAEVEGSLHAVLSLADGSVVADPFRRTTAVIELLRARAGQLQDETPRRGRRSFALGWVSSRLGA